MTDEEAPEIRRKIRKAARLLLFKRHRKPGAKTWELKRVLGRNYREIIRFFDEEIQKIGLKVKTVSEGGEEGNEEKTRYYVVSKEHTTSLETRTFGWRIDDLAMLAATLLLILSRQGKAPLKEVERMLKKKFPKWRVEYVVDRFIRSSYLSEDDKGMLYIGWRTRAEVDQKALLDLLIGREKEK